MMPYWICFILVALSFTNVEGTWPMFGGFNTFVRPHSTFGAFGSVGFLGHGYGQFGGISPFTHNKFYGPYSHPYPVFGGLKQGFRNIFPGKYSAGFNSPFGKAIGNGFNMGLGHGPVSGLSGYYGYMPYSGYGGRYGGSVYEHGSYGSPYTVSDYWPSDYSYGGRYYGRHFDQPYSGYRYRYGRAGYDSYYSQPYSGAYSQGYGSYYGRPAYSSVASPVQMAIGGASSDMIDTIQDHYADAGVAMGSVVAAPGSLAMATSGTVSRPAYSLDSVMDHHSSVREMRQDVQSNRMDLYQDMHGL